LSSESDIIAQCLAGQKDKYRILVDQVSDSLIRTAYYYLGNWEDARDAAQDALISGFNHLNTFKSDRPFFPWIHRILINTCKDRLRSAGYRRRGPLPEEIPDRNSDEILQRLADRELIQMALEKLPFSRRRVLVLVDLEGFSSQAAAEVLKCSPSTVRVTLMKAREQFRKCIIENLSH
jgi:RNA polymerase sigma-70 factor (ECF subfamily)